MLAIFNRRRSKKPQHIDSCFISSALGNLRMDLSLTFELFKNFPYDKAGKVKSLLEAFKERRIEVLVSYSGPIESDTLRAIIGQIRELRGNDNLDFQSYIIKSRKLLENLEDYINEYFGKDYLEKISKEKH